MEATDTKVVVRLNRLRLMPRASLTGFTNIPTQLETIQITNQ